MKSIQYAHNNQEIIEYYVYYIGKKQQTKHYR